MKITISSGEPGDPRTVLVEDEGMEAVSFTADNLADAQAKAMQGLNEGWDSVADKPDEPDKPTKASKK